MTSDPLKTLELMLSDMDSAPEIYRPTNFWDSGLTAIIDDLKTEGFENFRSHRSAISMYVPTFADRFYHKHKRRIDRFLSRLSTKKQNAIGKVITGQEKARNDYRLFRATDQNGPLGLSRFSESPVGEGERYEFEGRQYSRSTLNYLRALTLLEKEVDTAPLLNWLEIGGGYGSLGEIILKGRDSAFYINVDIPPVAAVSTWYLKQVFGEENILGYAESRTMDDLNIDELRKTYRAVILCPWQLPKLTGETDVFANFISFQEMEPAVVQNYINKVQPMTRHAVLMRNSRYGKALATKSGDLGVVEPVTTDFVQTAFDAFEVKACDSLIYGAENMDRSFRSEVTVMTPRKGG